MKEVSPMGNEEIAQQICTVCVFLPCFLFLRLGHN